MTFPKQFAEQILQRIQQEIKELNPAVLKVLKKGMKGGEKEIDKIQLDSAKAASVLIQEYLAHLIGRPVSRTEIAGKNGDAINVSISFEDQEESDYQNNDNSESEIQDTQVAETTPSEQ